MTESMFMLYPIQGGPKWHRFVRLITSPDINRFSKSFAVKIMRKVFIALSHTSLFTVFGREEINKE